MEGELWKWTNYWNGWQSRWFILDEEGVLSYFKSYEEVSQGCKGSISLNVCEIIVNSSDSTRLDLNVSNEQYLYLKANSEKERQQWLVALGSAKAGLANRQQRRRISSTASTMSDISTNQAIPHFNDSLTPNNSEALKSKKSELRLYCDLLMQQVHTVKKGASESNGSHHLLEATCDTFIKTLDELMEMADSQFSIYSALPSPQENGTKRNSRERSTTPNFYTKPGVSSTNRTRISSTSSRNSPTIPEQEEEPQKSGFKDVFGSNYRGDKSNQSSPIKNPQESNPFPLKKHFPKPNRSGEIKSLGFIEASRKILIIYDFLGKSFVPVKTEVKGHVKGLETKFKTDIEAFENINDIVNAETMSKKSNMPTSATSALQWAARHLLFLQAFLTNFVDSKDVTIQQCLEIAYGNTLAKHHDQVIQSVFAVAIQSSPSRSTFMENFHLQEEDVLKRLLREYLSNLELCLAALKPIVTL